MKKNLAILVAAMLCACCLGLAACGGSSSSSAASGSASASASSATSESASASATSASAAASSAAASSAAATSDSAASSAAASEVSPGLKEAAEKLQALADQQTALVEKAKAEGNYDAVKAEWDALDQQIKEAIDALQPWVQQLSDGTISNADKSYYMNVVVPAASKSADAGLEMLDIILAE